MSVRDNLTTPNKNNLGSYLDILEYDSIDNLFEAPSDGYIRMHLLENSNQNSKIRAEILGANEDEEFSFSYVISYSPYGANSGLIPIKKGMKCYFETIGSASHATFISFE